ncbi:MAG: ATP-binding protein [Oscillospiraceae bacterium]|nr:ATP-binding protein [Oscillospiraceae bacterium]
MKRILFLRYLMIGLLAAAVAAAGVFLYLNTEARAPLWIWILVGIAVIVGLCLFFAFKEVSSFVGSVDRLNDEMSQRGEQMSFSDLGGTQYPEIALLQENIRKLCGKIIASRKKLRQQQERFDFILNNMGEGILITDLSGVITSINKKAAQVLGLKETVLKQNISDVIQEKAILEAVKKAADRNKVTSFDLQAADGNTYALTSHLIREEAGDSSLPRKTLIFLTLTDVTAERSALKQRQDFFSNASHELKTPITSIQGFAELLESGIVTDPERVKDSIKVIRREATRMNRIISDLLMISSLEHQSRDSAGEPTMVNIGELLSEIRDSLRVSMMEKHITMEVSGGNFSIPIVREHMHNLFGNLMQNAVKYNVENGKVWVRAEIDGKYLYLTVKDTGIGIPADMKTRVFERFFRVDKGRSRSVGGTGLGLSIVKHIVTLYDGSIQLDSVLGEGTTIHAKLKYLTAPAQE